MNNPKWEKRTPPELKEELDGYLRDVPGTIDGQAIPPAGARVVISPYVDHHLGMPIALVDYGIDTLDMISLGLVPRGRSRRSTVGKPNGSSSLGPPTVIISKAVQSQASSSGQLPSAT